MANTVDPDDVEALRGTIRALEERLERARSHIQCAEERFRMLFDRSQDAMMTLAPPSWRFTTCNDRIGELFGVASADVFLSLEPWRVSPEFQPDGRPSREKALEMIEKAMREGSHFFEWVHQRADGETFPATVQLTRVGCDQRAFLLATVREVGDSDRARAALRETERMYATLVDNLPGFVYRCKNDAAWTMEFISSGCLAVTGYAPGDFIQNHRLEFVDIIVEEHRGPIWEAWQEHLARHVPIELEYPIRTASGQERWVWERGQGVFDGDGRLLFLEGFISDVTDRRQAEQERGRLQVQLAQAQKMESVGRLAGGVAHDFNNMLGVIIGHVGMILQRADLEDQLRADLVDVEEAARRSADLTRQLLAFARRQTVAPVRMDLNDTIGRLVVMLTRLIGENIRLTWRPDPAALPVRIDPSQVDQILTNLCVNARDAIDGVGQIVISTADVTFGTGDCALIADCQPGRYTRVSVLDDGCGMDEDTLARVFEPFFSTKGLGEGTGLGLSIVYGVVRQNGGFVQVDSAPGMGTEFRLFLPVDPGVPQSTGRPDSRAEPAGGHETVLLVEDEPAVLRFARRVLEGAGYAVLSATSPAEALRISAGHPAPIAALVTDVIMPDLNGVVLAERIRQAHPGIRCVFMSGYAEDIISRHGALEPGVRFLQKPFTLQELKRKLREALDG